MLMASQLYKLQSEQMIASMAVNMNKQGMESAEEISRWENFRKMACEDMDNNVRSRLLREMELDVDDSDSDNEIANTEMFNKADYTSTKRNLLPELEECVDTLEQQEQQK